MRNKLSLKLMIVLLVCIVVLMSLLMMNIRADKAVSDRVKKHKEEVAFHVSRIIANAPIVIGGLEGIIPEARIQDYTEKLIKELDVQFIVVMDMDGVRKSHPDPDEIGKRFKGGDEDPVLSGKEYVSISEGTLGVSLRTFTPVYNSNGTQIGAVAVGVLIDELEKEILSVQKDNAIGISYGLLIGIFGAVVIAHFIKKILYGLEPFEIAKIHQERNRMLESVREGIIAVDHTGKITIVNKSAEEIFKKTGIDKIETGKHIDTFVKDSVLVRVLKTGQSVEDEESQIKDVKLLINSVPIIVNGKIAGAISTFRDQSEVRLLAEQLSGVKHYAEVLRAQSHEFMNRLHVILGLLTLKEYDSMANYINRIVHNSQDEMENITRNIKNPYLAGFIIGKHSAAREKGIALELSIENVIPNTNNQEFTHDLITILGNLIQNASDAVEKSGDKKISMSLLFDGELLTVVVEDTGIGIREDDKGNLFDKGFSSKGEKRGYGLYLAKKSAEKYGGCLAFTSEENKGTIFVLEIPYNAGRDQT